MSSRGGEVVPLLVQRIEEAQDWIRERGGGFPELVFSHIDDDVAVEQENTAVANLRLFVTGFRESSRRAGFYLAGQLCGQRLSSASVVVTVSRSLIQRQQVVPSI
jgi:hypothetical protein